MKKNKIRDAVSLVFVLDNKIFSIVRQNYLKAFPGYTAFPGGKVDLDDYDDIGFNTPILNLIPVHLSNAIVRETKEELGIEIDRLIESGGISTIDFIGRALTPKFNPHRFNVHFYRINLTRSTLFHVDENEAKSYDWLTPVDLLESYNLGERLIVPPIRFFIEAMIKDINFSDELIFEKRFNLEKIVPFIEPIKDLIQVMPLSNTVPPAERTNAFLIGEQTKVLIDPAPKDIEELSKFLETIKNYTIEKMFLTHHHRDHHNFAPEIATKLNLSISMSQFTYTRSMEIYGNDYFGNNKIIIVKEGDILTRWLTQDVEIIEVPGHDEGQLALMPENREWFLAGDLFQGVGTVVVGGVEGDMTKYFNTLEKVIALKPKCVIPSHGIALGGTNILEKTLEHRKFREEQILEMHISGLSVEQMLAQIYFDIPQKILKYAKANIESHLDKLMIEKRI
jgi:glyoxylase-like metal-dependent hydrolase (beta-lactamase superfamily II)/8-oxo-dGTP pyrophosphatase MutT (NUDIX family)